MCFVSWKALEKILSLLVGLFFGFALHIESLRTTLYLANGIAVASLITSFLCLYYFTAMYLKTLHWSWCCYIWIWHGLWNLIFSDKGTVYSARAYKIPECSRTAAGTPLVHVFFYSVSLRVCVWIGGGVNTNAHARKIGIGRKCLRACYKKVWTEWDNGDS